MKALTNRELEVTEAIRVYRRLHGYAPTLQELADQIGTSKVTLHEHINNLVKKQVLKRDRHKSRTLEIIDGAGLPDKDPSTTIPVLGTISAGRPIQDAETWEQIDLQTLFSANGGVYVLRVRGESMVDDHLCNGDYVVIERRETARNGEQVVAILDGGEATLKRFYKEGRDRIRLQPANSTMEPRIVQADRCKILGVVIGAVRSYN